MRALLAERIGTVSGFLKTRWPHSSCECSPEGGRILAVALRHLASGHSAAGGAGTLVPVEVPRW
jgi:hypothetical protein